MAVVSTDESPVAWLRAAITERLELARKATQAVPWEPENDDPTDDEVWIDVDGEPWRMVISCRGPQSHENMLHIAANDPQDTIARCEAELAILDLYEQQAAKWYENAMQEDRAWTLWPVIALLASGYRHRPGYRAEWAPTPG